MAKAVKKSQELSKKKTYVRPTETTWGKIIIWLLIIGMVGVVLFTFIMGIIGLF